jgi:hypothetical protein
MEEALDALVAMECKSERDLLDQIFSRM